MVPQNDKRYAVLLAHPGHELVIHALIERVRPLVAVLTDGSGNSGTSRLASTTRVLDEIGAVPGSFYGEVTDAACYAALLTRNTDFFISAAEALASMLVTSRVDVVVGDAREGWNPIHDIWRSTVNAAVELAAQRRGREIENFDFTLFASHRDAARTPTRGAIVLDLDEGAYERKMASASTYSELHDEFAAAMQGTTAGLAPTPEMAAELDKRLGSLGPEWYRVEFFRPTADRSASLATERPLYELYGELMHAAGRYEQVIRQIHLMDIENALRRHAHASASSLAAAN